MNETSLTQAMFSSKKMDPETPQDFFDKVNEEFHFQIDVCATRENTKCDAWISPEDNALSAGIWGWPGRRCWMNPPYGRTIGKWMQKAYEQSQEGLLVVCLIPARTDTKWWHNWAMKGEIRFIQGRLRFGGFNGRVAPFPSALVIFRPKSIALP